MGFAIFAAISCNHAPSGSIPLPAFSTKELSYAWSGTLYAMPDSVYDEFDKYIKDYGDRGWIVGLTDKRNLMSACPNVDGRPVAFSTDVTRNPFRVCDFFMLQYVSTFKIKKKDVRAYNFPFSTPEQRDREMEYLIEFIKAHPMSSRSNAELQTAARP
ncbi:MAG TPA: hypothetical protein VNU49_09125 [Opitutaceae bacterium]|nr:hypothetical protein [Opitutaceae bacterium]